MGKIEELKLSILENGKRLDEIKAGGDEASKRVKKRILQKLGKLKKDLAELTGADGDKEPAGESTLSGKRKAGDEEDEGDEKDTPVAPTMSKEERKVKLRLLNKDLAEFAQKKQLTFARKRFEQAVRKDIRVDVHSYTNLINAYVRCSDLDGAEQTLQRMVENDVTPNLVTYTTLLKGYSESGDMSEAGRIYFKSLSAFRPNVRSLNTFLRACVRTGQVNPALQSYHNFVTYTLDTAAKSDNKANSKQQKGKNGANNGNNTTEEEEDSFECDASSYEYLLGLLCRAGARSAAESVLRSFTELSGTGSKAVSAGGVSAIENTAIYLTLAMLHTLQGDYASAAKWADLSADALQRTESATLKDSMLKRFQASAAESDKTGGAKGGKKDDGDGSRSVALFLKHRRTELEGQLNMLQDYLGMAMANTQGVKSEGVHGKLFERLQAQSHACAAYLCCLSQVLPFGFDGQCDFDSLVLSEAAAALYRGGASDADKEAQRIQSEGNETSIAARLLVALRDKFGLDIFTLPELAELGLQPDQLQAASEPYQAAKQVVAQAHQNTVKKIASSVDAESGHISFQKLFTPLGFVADNAKSTAGAAELEQSLQKLPVKLEICSGDGEWVVAQAGADWTTNLGTAMVPLSTRQPKALWVALELRCDRIQHTMAHYMMSNPHATLHRPPAASDTLAPLDQRLHNLALLGGNAAKVIPERIAPASISEIFINHPQPPDRVTGGGDVSTEGSSRDKHAQKKNKRDGGKDKNQGAHLLTQEFFAQLVRVLKADGTITIVTDNQAYAKSLAASIASLPAQTCSTAERGEIGDDDDEEEEKGATYRAVLAGGIDRYRLSDHWDHSLDDSYPITTLSAPVAAAAEKKDRPAVVPLAGGCGRSVDVWRGEPGVEAGHVVDASSYFDRMWDLGQKKRRWFIFVKKSAL